MAYGGTRKCIKVKLPGRIDAGSKWGQHRKIMKEAEQNKKY